MARGRDGRDSVKKRAKTVRFLCKTVRFLANSVRKTHKMVLYGSQHKGDSGEQFGGGILFGGGASAAVFWGRSTLGPGADRGFGPAKSCDQP